MISFHFLLLTFIQMWLASNCFLIDVAKYKYKLACGEAISFN